MSRDAILCFDGSSPVNDIDLHALQGDKNHGEFSWNSIMLVAVANMPMTHLCHQQSHLIITLWTFGLCSCGAVFAMFLPSRTPGESIGCGHAWRNAISAAGHARASKRVSNVALWRPCI